MRFDHKSLKIKTWLYFIFFTTIILAVLWLLQIIFIKTFYQKMKINEIIKIGKSIIAEYDNGDIDMKLSRLAFKNNLFIMIYDNEDNIVISSDIFGGGRNRDRAFMPLADDFRYFKQQLTKSGEKSMHFISGGKNMERLFYGSAFNAANGTELFIFITAGLQPIDTTVEILKNIFIVVTIILLLLSFFVAYMFSIYISKPVIKLTNTAKQLASGDLYAVFEKGNYSEINQLADTLNYATKEISRVDTLRKDLIANISHDLRTPLTVVKMYAEMIRDVSGDNPVKRNEHAELIISESDRLTDLVYEILEFSKLQSEKFMLNRKTFNLSKMLNDIIVRFQVLTKKEGYVFYFDIDSNLYTNADETQIERVLCNLISNAVNYTGEDKVVNVRLKCINGKLIFEATDTGCGIPDDQQANIWERYYRANETHKRAVIGTGLGLSIVKHILRQHNAKFGVKSVVGQGSTFWFELNKI